MRGFIRCDSQCSWRGFVICAFVYIKNLGARIANPRERVIELRGAAYFYERIN